LKIKCPICTIDNLNPEGELGNHIIAHGDEAGMYLRDLTIKIHEKIEQYEKDSGSCSYYRVEVLKSLLEDKK
jgi:hypothetical protein